MKNMITFDNTTSHYIALHCATLLHLLSSKRKEENRKIKWKKGKLLNDQFNGNDIQRKW